MLHLYIYIIPTRNRMVTAAPMSPPANSQTAPTAPGAPHKPSAPSGQKVVSIIRKFPHL